MNMSAGTALHEAHYWPLCFLMTADMVVPEGIAARYLVSITMFPSLFLLWGDAAASRIMLFRFYAAKEMRMDVRVLRV